MTDLRGRLSRQEPMARHTTWRAGGPADQFYEPADLADLAEFLHRLPAEEPISWIGLGSNLLVRDGGIRGTVIVTAGLDKIEPLETGKWRIEAGVACAKVARLTGRAGMQGAEFLAGIPGSFGGALAMNAGAFGGETWLLVTQAETIDRQGILRQRPPQDFHVGYRQVQIPPAEFFVSAVIALQPATDQHHAERIRRLLELRKQTQPIGLPSCGSVFRNPPPLWLDGVAQPRFAAQLIEAAGLKGYRIGDAYVSGKHANFIINSGQAQAADIEQLIHHVQEVVEAKHGIRLEPEVRVVGET